jgi:hypothetical protein
MNVERSVLTRAPLVLQMLYAVSCRCLAFDVPVLLGSWIVTLPDVLMPVFVVLFSVVAAIVDAVLMHRKWRSFPTLVPLAAILVMGSSMLESSLRGSETRMLGNICLALTTGVYSLMIGAAPGLMAYNFVYLVLHRTNRRESSSGS